MKNYMYNDPAGATSMTYDANGNMTGWSDSSGSHTLTYDFENRLASFVTSSVTASYLYDPQGRRLEKTVNGVTTRYLWDGATMIAELDGTNQVQRIHTYNPQTMEPVSTAIGCTAYFYITDHLMTPQMLTSMSDTTVWYAELNAFGTATLITDTVTNNLRFPGQYADVESGLYYNYARYYMPSIGRYIQPDLINITTLQIVRKALAANLNYISYALEPHESYPVSLIYKLLLTTPQMQNAYLYTGSNPLTYIDYKGQSWWVGAVAAALAGYYIIKIFLPPNPDELHLPTDNTGTAEPNAGEGSLPNSCQEIPSNPPLFPQLTPINNPFPAFSNSNNPISNGPPEGTSSGEYEGGDAEDAD